MFIVLSETTRLTSVYMANWPNACSSIIVTGACDKGKMARATTPTQTLRPQAVIESLHYEIIEVLGEERFNPVNY